MRSPGAGPRGLPSVGARRGGASDHGPSKGQMESVRVLDNEGTTSLLRGTEIVEGPALTEAWVVWCVEGDPPTTSHGEGTFK